MPNIAGILGYAPPGAYSIARTRQNTVALPGGPRIPVIIGNGYREEILVSRASGNGTEGWPADWESASPDGRHFKTAVFPIREGSFDLYLNPKNDGTDVPLKRTGDVYGVWPDEGIDGVESEGEPLRYTLDEESGQIVLDHILAKKDRLVCIYQAIADFNDPELFFDPQLLYEKHGYPSVFNTLSLGAQIAFENGAPAVMAVQAGYDGVNLVPDLTWTLALKALEREDEADILVPLASRRVVGEIVAPGTGSIPSLALGQPPVKNTTTDPVEIYVNQQLLTEGVDYTINTTSGEITLIDPSILGVWDKMTANYTPDIDSGATDNAAGILINTLEHCEDQSSTPGRHERKMHTGGFIGMSNDDMIKFVNEDTTFHQSFRCIYHAPSVIYRTVLGSVTALDGLYIGCASAGYMAGEQYLPEPLTRKTLLGFTILKSQKLSDAEMNRLATNHITVNIPLASGSRVRHGLTTIDNGVPEEEEPSIIEIRDYTAKTARTILENTFVGKPITNILVPAMGDKTRAILLSLKEQRIIFDFGNIIVVQDRLEPRQVNVSFDIQPIYPLNWIRIEFSVGLL